MLPDTMSTKERIKWYSSFIDEASKIGDIDPAILLMKRGLVEMLRVETQADPEDAAVAYLAVQARAKERRSTPNNDQVLSNGVAVEDQIAFEEWFIDFCNSIGDELNPRP